jgi:hypothetical protein
MTIPFVQLMMAVDDVRRALGHLMEATSRISEVSEFEKYLPVGDHLYAMRLLYSHVHEAGNALRALDVAAKARVDAALTNKSNVMEDLEELRRYFNRPDYKRTVVARMRNAIGFHYNRKDIAALVEKYFVDDAESRATAAESGVLGRMADQLLIKAFDDVLGGDLLARESAGGDTRAEKNVREMTRLMVKLTSFVDELFESLVSQRLELPVTPPRGVIKIPQHVLRFLELHARGRGADTQEEEARDDGPTR